MPALSVAGPEIEQFAGKRTRPVPRFAGLLSYMPLQPISEISVKLGSSAVAEFGFGLRLPEAARPSAWGGQADQSLNLTL